MSDINNEPKREWKKVKNKLLGENAIVESVEGNSMTVTRYEINKQVTIPLHYHDYEQIIYVLEGEMNLVVENEQFFMKAGDIKVILGNEKHSAEIVGVPFKSIESYYPKRTDLVIDEL